MFNQLERSHPYTQLKFYFSKCIVNLRDPIPIFNSNFISLILKLIVPTTILVLWKLACPAVVPVTKPWRPETSYRTHPPTTPTNPHIVFAFFSSTRLIHFPVPRHFPASTLSTILSFLLRTIAFPNARIFYPPNVVSSEFCIFFRTYGSFACHFN